MINENIHEYYPFRDEDLKRSKTLAEKLGVPPSDFSSVQHWFDWLLLFHLKAQDIRDRLKTKHEIEAEQEFTEQLKTEKKLKIEFDKLISVEIQKDSYKYVVAKLLHYNNAFWGKFFHRLPITRIQVLLRDHLIPMLITDVHYSVLEYLALTEYLKHTTPIYRSGFLIADVLALEKADKICQKAGPKEKFEILKNLLHLINEKGYHHDIACFKKILMLISENDSEIIAYLKKFKVLNNQGCYTIIHDILNLKLSQNHWTDFKTKVDLLHFLDLAKRSQPSLNWEKKFVKLSAIISDKQFDLITKTVMKNSNGHIFVLDSGAQWSDDTAKRFLRSVSWIKMKLDQSLSEAN